MFVTNVVDEITNYIQTHKRCWQVPML